MVPASEGEHGVLSDAGKDKDRRSLLERQENIGKTQTFLTIATLPIQAEGLSID